MNIIYAPEPVILLGRSIFLAGPTPRSKEVDSWRPHALELLEKLKFQGTVLVPEHRHWDRSYNFINQVEWEWEGLEGCDKIVFWIPRELKTMPAFTTNVEFGSYVRSGRAVYGRPDGSPKNDYLDWLYGKVTKQKPFNNLFELLTVVVNHE
jgi:hypothetical protein